MNPSIFSDEEWRVMELERVVRFADGMRAEGKTIVTTNGAFDLLHPGHQFLFQEARKHGDIVIVGVNSDATVKRTKGPDRPIEHQLTRALHVATHADAVFVFDDPDPREWLKKIRPHVHVNAETYGENCIEAPVLKEIGARLVLVPVKKELGSTTETMRKRLCDIPKFIK